MEMTTFLPALVAHCPDIHVVYRPLNHPWMDRFVRRSRERFGLHLLSRKGGLYRVFGVLKDGGIVVFLYDQSAGDTGVLTTFLGQLASTTDLPGRYVERLGADVYSVYVERTGFWRARLRMEKLRTDKTAVGVTVAANRWLEAKLLDDPHFYENWMWMHNRWKTQWRPESCLRVAQKRNILEQTLRLLGKESLDRSVRAGIRMPNWLGDVLMAIPGLRALSAGRPDFELHFFVAPHFIPLLRDVFAGAQFHPLPQKRRRYWHTVGSYRNLHLHLWIALTHSLRSCMETFLVGAPLRLGIKKYFYNAPPLFTHVAPVNPKVHQTLDQYDFYKKFGLTVPLDTTPFASRPKGNLRTMGIFCGSENDPRKRWTPDRWAQFVKKFGQDRRNMSFFLFGTDKDSAACLEIVRGCGEIPVESRAGQTDLKGLKSELLGIDCVVANDSGGAHLANAMGIPTVVLFGPTSSERTAPIFNAPKKILRSPSGTMDGFVPEAVAAEVGRWWEELS
jgi:ADP-heptose:LPS heptosyltransferase